MWGEVWQSPCPPWGQGQETSGQVLAGCRDRAGGGDVPGLGDRPGHGNGLDHGDGLGQGIQQDPFKTHPPRQKKTSSGQGRPKEHQDFGCFGVF